jgi:hypothetical protein
VIKKDRNAGFADFFPGRNLFAREHRQREQQNGRNACSDMRDGTPVTGRVLMCLRRAVAMAVTGLCRHEDGQQKT